MLVFAILFLVVPADDLFPEQFVALDPFAAEDSCESQDLENHPIIKFLTFDIGFHLSSPIFCAKKFGSPLLPSFWKAPTLYYEKKLFEYTLDVGKPWNARHAFLTHRGSCAEITMFSLICLKKGGYRASAYDPKLYQQNFPWPHLLVLFRGKDGRLYSMDNGRPKKKGIQKFP